MSTLSKNKSLQFGFVVFATLVSINLWSFQKIPESIYNVLEVVVSGMLVLILITNSYVFNKKGLLFKTNVILFGTIPFLSAFGAYIYHDQPFNLSLLLLRPNLFWLFYFVLHVFDVPTKKIINLMVFIGFVWAALTIIQQFTYPNAWFYTREDGDTQSIYRAGVYRFMLSGQQYGLFALVYYFYKYLTTNDQTKIRNIIYIFFGLLGFYFYGTRQYALSAVACMGIAVLYLKAKQRAMYIALLVPVVLIIFLFKDALFGGYIELTNRQMAYGYDQDIRYLCADFYLNDYWPDWTAKIIGNGLPHMLSDYGREMNLILAYFHFYRSDVGLIGVFNKFGILYVLNIFWVITKGLTIKIHENRDKYLKIFFFNALFLSIINESFSSMRAMPFYCFLFFLIEKSIREYKEKNEALQEDIVPLADKGQA